MLQYENMRKIHLNKFTKFLIYLVSGILVAWVILVIVFRPSHDREWEFGQESLPRFVEQGDGTFSVENFRNFDWNDDGSGVLNYETRTIDPKKIETADVFISHFDDFEGLAHIFITFGTTDGEHLVVSLETRREKGEKFSPILGILRQFEIIYVVGSERDIAGLRTDVRGERVYLYPTNASPEGVRNLFYKLVEDINDVYETPRMYNTLTHNCTNEITRPVEEISDIDFPLTWKSILPGYFDEILFAIELIPFNKVFSEIKAAHLIPNTLVHRDSPTYEGDIRAAVGIK